MSMQPKTCRSGRHLKTPDNIYTSPKGASECLACRRESGQRRKERAEARLTPLDRLLRGTNRGYFTSENAAERLHKSAETRRAQIRAKAEQPPPSTRVCRKCSVEKSFDDFMAAKNCLWGRSYTCKPCYRQQGKDWKARNPGWEKAYRRDYRRENRDREMAAQRRWREKNPEHAAKLQQQAYERFRADPERWGRYKEYARRLMAAKRAGNGPERVLMDLVDKCTGDVPVAIRDIVRQDIFLRVQTKDIARMELIRGSAIIKESVKAAWKDMPDRFGSTSLDAPLGEDGTLTLADLLADESDVA